MYLCMLSDGYQNLLYIEVWKIANSDLTALKAQAFYFMIIIWNINLKSYWTLKNCILLPMSVSLWLFLQFFQCFKNAVIKLQIRNFQLTFLFLIYILHFKNISFCNFKPSFRIWKLLWNVTWNFTGHQFVPVT